jgi:hypothetical protein
MFGESRAESATEGSIVYGTPARYFNNGRYNVIIMCIASCAYRLLRTRWVIIRKKIACAVVVQRYQSLSFRWQYMSRDMQTLSKNYAQERG